MSTEQTQAATPFQQPQTTAVATVGELAGQTPRIMQMLVAAKGMGIIATTRDNDALKKAVLDDAKRMGGSVQYSIPYRTKECPACHYKLPPGEKLPPLYSPCPKCKTKMVVFVTGTTRKLADSISNHSRFFVDQTIVHEDSMKWKIETVVIDTVTMTIRRDETTVLKPKAAWDLEDQRKLDMLLNSAKSKSRRNLILQIAPAWLTDDAVEAGMNNKTSEVRELGASKFQRRLQAGLATVGVDWARALVSVDLPVNYKFREDDEDDAEILAELKARYIAVKDGDETAATMFPEIEAKDGGDAEKPKGEKADAAPPSGGFPGAFSESAHKNRGNLKAYEDLCAKYGPETVHDVLPEFTRDYAALGPDAQKAVLANVATRLGNG